MHCDSARAEKPAHVESRCRPYCGALFVPRRRWSAFCSTKCRNDYDIDFGAQGLVKSVRRLKGAVSVVLHFQGPAAERAIHFRPQEVLRIIKRTG